MWVTHGLLALALSTLVVSSPCATLVAGERAQVILAAGSDEAADGESNRAPGDFEGLPGIPDSGRTLTRPGFAHTIADRPRQMVSRLPAAHLERGPPGC